MSDHSHPAAGTSGETHAHGPGDASSFNPVDVAKFQAEDRHAAGAIAFLMVGIFTMGLFLYLGVALWVW
jgi:hypothetical protein